MKYQYDFSFWNTYDGWFVVRIFKDDVKVCEADVHASQLQEDIDYYLRHAIERNIEEEKEILQGIVDILTLWELGL